VHPSSETEEAAMAETPPDTVVEPVAAETADQPAATGAEPAPPVSPPARTWPPPAADLARIAAIGAVTITAAALIARRQVGPLPLERGESLAMSVRPRKVLRSYLTSAGLWEFNRRATRFTVTDRRLLVEEGVMKRVVTAVPLAVLQHVVVRTGPWQGWVDVTFPTSSGRGRERIGPLRAPVAREFAASLARRGDVTVDELPEG
jgi:hypothetical protein